MVSFSPSLMVSNDVYSLACLLIPQIIQKSEYEPSHYLTFF